MKFFKSSLTIWILILLFVLFFVSGCLNTEKSDEIELISAGQLYDILKKGVPEDTILIDVRTPEEYQEGYISGSNLIPVDEIEDRIDEIPKGKTIIVYCAVGVRSNNAANILKENGFEDIMDLEGGISAWVERGYPIEIEFDPAQEEYIEENSQSFSGIVFINAHTLKSFMESDMELLVIDIRTKGAFGSGHIPGAINIDLNDFESKLGEIPKNKAIVTYCSGTSCQLGKQAAVILLNNGYEEIYVLPGGIIEWEEEGFPIEQ